MRKTMVKNIQVLLFLARGFEEYEAAVFTDVMGWSRTDGTEGVALTTASLNSPVKGAWNLTVLPQHLLEEIKPEEFDALALPGGLEDKGYYEDVYQDAVLDLIRGFHAAGKPVASVCVGALALGRSGILKGRRATTYHGPGSLRRAQLAESGAKVKDATLVVDGGLITCHGPAAALDVAFTLLEMLTSRENVDAVKKAMGF